VFVTGVDDLFVDVTSPTSSSPASELARPGLRRLTAAEVADPTLINQDDDTAASS